MSSNTLRGIGQEEDGDADAAAAAKGVNTSATGPGGQAGAAGVVAGETSAAPSDDLTERVPDLRPDLRTITSTSLDSTIPGTRSLDSSVPEARPSLDAKVPALAATLLGVMAPTVSTGTRPNQRNQQDREKGTVQGRDVHLPAEAQRLAGVRAVADDVPAPGSSATAPGFARGGRAFDHSEPTLADPVRTAALAQEATDGGAPVPQAVRAPDSNSHGPWYDQDPTGGHEIYEDEKPSVLGRAAIGVAVAAGLSVVVFAVIRMTANNGDDGYTRPPAAVYEPSPALPPRPLAQPVAPTPSPSAAAADPGTDPVAGTSEAVGDPSATPPVGTEGRPTPSSPPRGGAAAGRRLEAPMGSSASGRPTVARVGGSPPRPTAARPAAATRTSPTTEPPRISSAPNSAVISAPPAAGTYPPALSRAPSESGTASTPPSTTRPAPANPDRPRGKSGYDPDSTLPLNLD